MAAGDDDTRNGNAAGDRPGSWLRAPNDLAAGLFLLACAALAWIFGHNLSMGNAFRMGAGYIPRMLWWIVGAFGLAMCANALRVPGPALARWPLRPIVLVLGAMVVFALSIERAGLLVASLAAVTMACLASRPSRVHEIAVLAACLAGAACLLFPIALQLPLKVWPWAMR
jgi:hypothetical protein